jgi:hypothetical protein
MTMRIKAAVHVEHPEEIGRPRWGTNRRLPEGRELIVSGSNFVLMLSEPTAMWLLAMLAAIIAPQQVPHGRSQPQPAMAGGGSPTEDIRAQVRVALRVHSRAEVGRPRWERHELVVTFGDVVVYLSEPAAKWLLKVLTAALAREPEVSRGVGEA